jgi:hypothetical protein
MASVFLLYHEHDDEDENTKLLGVYSTSQRAAARAEQAARLPGFRDHRDGFTISEYRIDRDEWPEGFVATPEGIDLPAWLTADRVRPADPPAP